MQIEIRNFLGIEAIDIPMVNAPVLVTGPNTSGKTSLSTAIGALLARTDNPLSLAASRQPYLNDKADSGSVVMRDDNGVEYLAWHLLEKGIRALPDCPAAASKHVLGLTDFIHLAPKYRVDVWEGCFLPPPRDLVEMVGKELEQQLSSTAAVEEVVAMLRSRSWDDCMAVFSHKAKESKRNWSTISGEPYGTRKADRWTPRGWRSDLDNLTHAEARTKLEEAREALRMVQVGQAVAEADVARGQRAAAEIPNIEKDLDIAKERYNGTKAQHDTVSQEFANLKAEGLSLRQKLEQHDRQQPIREDTTPCPACGEALVVGMNRSLTRARDESAFNAQLRAWQMGREKLERDLNERRVIARDMRMTKVDPVATTLEKQRTEMQGVLSRMSTATREARMSDGHVVTEEDQRLAAEAEQRVEDAKEAVDLIVAKTKAHQEHMNAVNYAAIAFALGPKGIRSRAMKSKMDELDSALREIEQVALWPRVTLDSTYAVSIAGRVGVVNSASDKWRANYMLQSAIAFVLGEQRVLADGADILDADGRLQFIRLVDWMNTQHIYTIVCATGSIGEEIPASWRTVEIVNGKVA